MGTDCGGRCRFSPAEFEPPVDNLGGRPPCGWHTDDVARRFLPLTEVSEILDISAAQAYALVRTGDLPAIKVGGRGQWRVETVELEAYIQRMYAETRDLVSTRTDGSSDGDEHA